MTFEEARAQFPVLDRFAYLQAGSVGPLARATVEAMENEERGGLQEGRGSYERFMRAARRARGAASGRRGARRGLDRAGRAHRVDDRRVQHRARRPRAVRRRRDRSPPPTSTSASSARSTRRVRRSSSSDPDPERIAAAVTPRTRLIALSHVLWTTGAVLPVHELRAATGRTDPRRRSAVRRRARRSTRRASTSTRSRGRSGCAGPREPARSSSPTPSRCASVTRATSRRTATSTTARSSRGPELHVSIRTSRLTGRLRASRCDRRDPLVGVRAGSGDG